jgi:hypothetical protein
MIRGLNVVYPPTRWRDGGLGTPSDGGVVVEQVLRGHREHKGC